ncbi:MAG: hypothetical protein R3C44_08585 [Chloroflexota bacterium]
MVSKESSVAEKQVTERETPDIDLVAEREITLEILTELLAQMHVSANLSAELSEPDDLYRRTG